MFGYTFGELRGTPEWETMKKYIYDHLANGSFKPKIARTFPFEQTVEAYTYLESNEQIGNASGLYNLLRNIGGSVGISLVDTFISRRQQAHRNDLSRYLSPNAAVENSLLRLQSYMSLHAGPHVAKLRAYALLQNGLDQQSTLYAYVDDLRYMAAVCALCLPIVFFLRPVKAKKGAAPAAH